PYRAKRPVLPLLDHDELRTQLQDLSGGGDHVLLPGEQLGLAVVHYQAVNLLQQGQEVVAGRLDPEVHGVGDDEPAALERVGELRLELRVRIGQEDVLRVQKASW